MFMYGAAVADPGPQRRTHIRGRKGRRSCTHLTGARRAFPVHGRRAVGGKPHVMAEHTAERDDHPGAERGPAGLPRATGRIFLDHPGRPTQTSPASRATTQAQRGVVGGSHRPPPARPVSPLRQCTVRTGLVLSHPRWERNDRDDDDRCARPSDRSTECPMSVPLAITGPPEHLR